MNNNLLNPENKVLYASKESVLNSKVPQNVILAFF